MQVADRSIALKRRQKTSLIGAKEKTLAKLVDNYFTQTGVKKLEVNKMLCYTYLIIYKVNKNEL